MSNNNLGNIDWAGLLAWSTKYHDGTHKSEFKPMSPERREFLEKAIEETLGIQENPNDTMKEAINKLNTIINNIKNTNNEDDKKLLYNEAITALALLDGCTDYPDCPRNLDILGGIEPLLYLCTSNNINNITVKNDAGELLALMLSNNIPVQEACLHKYNGLNILLDSINNTDNDTLLISLLSALGSLIRSYPEAESLFIKKDANKVIAKLLNNKYSIRVRQKAAALYKYLLNDGRANIVDSNDVANAVIQLYKDDDIDDGDIQYYEILAGLSLQLKEYPGIKDVVKDRIKIILNSKDKEYYQPELALLIQTAK